MKVLVVGNCAALSYTDALRALFPDWDVRLVDQGSAKKWLIDESKPEYIQFLQSCDLFVGHPHLFEFQPFGNKLNPKADRIIIPGLAFSGLHPDIAILPGFDGAFSDSQTSLIAISAYALGLSVDEGVKLYNETTYTQLGYFDYYEIQKQRVIHEFRQNDIDLTDDFLIWESRGGGDSFIFRYMPVSSCWSISFGVPFWGATSIIAFIWQQRIFF
jgi:Polysaccharide biosynthesis enzyme WcbI